MHINGAKLENVHSYGWDFSLKPTAEIFLKLMCIEDDLSFNVKTEQGYQYYAYKDSDCIVIDGIHRKVTAS